MANPPVGAPPPLGGLSPAVGAVVPEPAEPAGNHPQRGAGGDRDPVVGDTLPQPEGFARTNPAGGRITPSGAAEANFAALNRYTGRSAEAWLRLKMSQAPVSTVEPQPEPRSHLRCPRCHAGLRQTTADSITCQRGHAYPVIDGIPDLMPEASLADPAKLVSPAVDLTVLLLTWNEADNLPILIPRIKAVVERLGGTSEILVIDKDSADGTAQVAASLGARVARQTEPGFGGALRMGFALARGRFICTMDADLSHEPEVLASLWNARQQAALVIGSRWVQGGGADMPLYRSTLSRLLNRIYGLALHVPYHDMSSNCRLYRAEVLRTLEPQGLPLRELRIGSRAWHAARCHRGRHPTEPAARRTTTTAPAGARVPGRPAF